MNVMQQTNQLLRQLEGLTTTELDLVIDFVNFLQYQKLTKSQAQGGQVAADSIAFRMDFVRFWEQWFMEVEALELSLAEPVSEYEEGLLAKYRQQGLEL
jgi:hypothetical protein